MIDLKTATSQEIASYFSNEVNSISFKPDRIAEGLKNSKLMEDLDICWIKTLSSHAYMTDLRNEASAKAGRKLSGIPFIKSRMESDNDPKMDEVAKKMAMGHRTLQQAFSKLVFYHFILVCNKRDSQELLQAMEDSFYRLPLI